MKFIIGKKLDMTQVWKGDDVVAVTRVQAGPCTVVQVRSSKKEGYDSLQLGFGEKKEKNTKKPQIGHVKGLSNFRYLKEFRLENSEAVRGDKINIDNFLSGDIVDVVGTSKGKGFAGAVKRHGFKGSKKTHGNKDQLRMTGSSGATGPAHVLKGTRKPGRMGGDRTTLKNLEIIEVDIENNILFVKGAIPGPKNGLLLISGEGELKVAKGEVKEVIEPKKEDKKIEEKQIEEIVASEEIKEEKEVEEKK